MKDVIFACVHNAGRSQMAAALFNALADPAKARARSAGTEPAARLHPEVVKVMAEVGHDLSSVAPRRLTEQSVKGAALLITMGCGEACPVVPGVERIDWPLEDPKGKESAAVRVIRDEIEQRVARLLRERGWTREGTAAQGTVGRAGPDGTARPSHRSPAAD